MFLFLMTAALVACHHEPTKPPPVAVENTTPPPPDTTGWTLTGDSGDSGTDYVCPTAVVLASPFEGDVDAYYRGTVRVELSLPDPAATLLVRQASDGKAIPGTYTVDEQYLTWVWNDPLLPLTEYITEVKHACGVEQVHWTTSEVGLPVTADLTNLTYSLDPSMATWIQPAGSGAAFALLLGDYRVLLKVTDMTDPTTIDLLLGAGLNGHQNNCAPTVDILDAAWLNPHFEIAPMDVVLVTDNFDLTISDFQVAGDFSSDGSRMQGVTMQGVLDTRNLGEALGFPAGLNTVCLLVAVWGVSCTACADGEPYCLDLEVENVEGPLSDKELQVVTEQEVSDNQNCVP